MLPRRRFDSHLDSGIGTLLSPAYAQQDLREGRIEIGSSNVRTMVSLLLRRRREASGLSLAEATRQVGVKSRNAYARYEKGGALPTIEKLDSLLRAVSKGRDFVVAESAD